MLVPGVDGSRLGVAGGNPVVGKLTVGGSPFAEAGGSRPGLLAAGGLFGSGGSVLCCAWAHSALADTVTTTPDISMLGMAGTTTGAVTAQAAVISRNVLRGYRYFNATLLYRNY